MPRVAEMHPSSVCVEGRVRYAEQMGKGSRDAPERCVCGMKGAVRRADGQG